MYELTPQPGHDSVGQGELGMVVVESGAQAQDGHWVPVVVWVMWECGPHPGHERVGQAVGLIVVVGAKAGAVNPL